MKSPNLMRLSLGVLIAISGSLVSADRAVAQPTYTAFKVFPYTSMGVWVSLKRDMRFRDFNARGDILLHHTRNDTMSVTLYRDGALYFINFPDTSYELDGSFSHLSDDGLILTMRRQRISPFEESGVIYNPADSSFLILDNKPAGQSTCAAWNDARSLISSNGQVFGSLQIDDNSSCRARWGAWAAGATSPGALSLIDTINGYFQANLDIPIWGLNVFTDSRDLLLRGRGAGSCQSCANKPHNLPYILNWDTKSTIPLPAPNGIWTGNLYNWSGALGLTNTGWAFGWSQDNSGDSIQRATAWQNGSPVLVDDLPGTMTSECRGMSDKGRALVDRRRVSDSVYQYFVWDNGAMTALSDLIVNDTFIDGGTVPTFADKSDMSISMNTRGDMLVHSYQPWFGGFSYRENDTLLILQKNFEAAPLKVNSTADAPDANPGDGLCSTGAIVNGEDECTLRAALMEANVGNALDTITFDVQGSVIPVIRPHEKLPPLTNPALIDGLSQPGGARVVVDGSTILDTINPVDGITISSENNEIRGLVIQNFSGAGVHIDSGMFNSIHDNIIGADSTGTLPAPNFGHGIRVSSSINSISDGGAIIGEHGNVIAFNGGAGVFVDSGINDVRITDNVIHSNGSLDIDLYPPGVNASDSLKDRDGANRDVQAPVIFSVFQSEFNGTDISGSFGGSLLKSYTVQFFAGDTCDESGSGEGKRYLGEILGATPGVAFLFNTFKQIDSTDVISATITDTDGNTSEFSLCWPQKTLRIVDTKNNPIPLTDFTLSRMAHDPPAFTETIIDTITTDSGGSIDISKYYWGYEGDTLAFEDTIKVSRIIHREPSTVHPTLVGDAYRIELDNGEFDSNGALTFNMLDTSPEQDIKLEHTTLVYNLVVSIEWDSDLAFINTVEQGMRNLANYMYDVMDGQLRIDTVMIYDNKENWDFCDVRIHASNTVWPHVAEVGGIRLPASGMPNPVEMPRQWFGTESATINKSFTEFPPDLSVPWSYRTVGHEFGHYALSLYDEYQFTSGSRCSDHPLVGPAKNPYGYMDSHYPESGPHASELSDATAYNTASCRNNLQWANHSESTWETVDAMFDKTYNALPAPIMQPSDRSLPPGLNYFPGPNDNMSSLNYDVGALVSFPVSHTAPNAISLKIRMTSEKAGAGSPKAGVAISLSNKNAPFSVFREQGKTSDSGGIWLLGFTSGDVIFGAGFATILGSSSRATGTERGWYHSQTDPGAVADGDSLVVVMQEVSGNKALIVNATLGADQLDLQLEAPGIFGANPSLSHNRFESAPVDYVFTPNTPGYTAAITDPLSPTGSFRVTAEDDSAALYFFDCHYAHDSLETGKSATLKTMDASVEAKIDNTSGSFENSVIISTLYPPLRNGLPPEAVQGGPTATVALYPQSPMAGDNDILIRYSDHDLETSGVGFTDESSLRIFHWNTAQQSWEALGGVVDTFFNEVSSPITEPGVYGAFTTESIGSCCDLAGDATNDGKVNIADITFTVAWLFNGGPNPVCFAEADATADGKLNIQDVTLLIAWLFNGGPDPVCGS